MKKSSHERAFLLVTIIVLDHLCSLFKTEFEHKFNGNRQGGILELKKEPVNIMLRSRMEEITSVI
jgi:hypothetical protein